MRSVAKLPRPQDLWGARLRAAQGCAKMTVADLAVWFDRSYATVRSWLYEGKQPPAESFRAEDARVRLQLLETIIRRADNKAKGWGIPIPVDLSQRKRGAFVRKVYKNATRDVPREIIR